VSEDDWDVIIVGAGAAGLFAAAAAAARGKRTLVIEKNRKIGVKILMSGGTRCNVTHDCSPRELTKRFAHARKFLEFPVGRLPPEEIVSIVNSEGVATKSESTGKIFPASDSAVDVRDALLARATAAGAQFRAGTAVIDVDFGQGRFACRTESGSVTAGSLILTTGGKSFPGCGTTGDGYAWAEKFGHTVVLPRPALTPLVSQSEWVRRLSGITIETCGGIAIADDGRVVGEAVSSSLLFTHTGFSGPLAMNLSRWFTLSREGRATCLQLDFLPDEKSERFSARIMEHVAGHPKQIVANMPVDPLPRRLLDELLQVAGIPADLKLGELGKKRLAAMVDSIKACRIPVGDTRGFAKAEVTAGGVSLDEVDNRTMQSRLQPGLFLAGEILDFDGPIGGYNFQAAFSTGHLAGQNA